MRLGMVLREYIAEMVRRADARPGRDDSEKIQRRRADAWLAAFLKAGDVAVALRYAGEAVSDK